MPAGWQWTAANRAAIQARCRRASDCSAMGAQLFKELPQEEKDVWLQRYEEEKATYDAWVASAEGQALKAQQAARREALRSAEQEQARKKFARCGRRKGPVEDINVPFNQQKSVNVTNGPAKGWRITAFLKEVDQPGKYRNVICWQMVPPGRPCAITSFVTLRRVGGEAVYTQIYTAVRPGLYRKISDARIVAETTPRKRKAPPMQADRDTPSRLPMPAPAPVRTVRPKTAVLNNAAIATQDFKPAAKLTVWKCDCEGHLRRHPRCGFSENLQPLLVHLRDVNTIGRQDTCDVVMDSKRTPAMMSRTHACLERAPDGSFSVEDRGSVNGVLVNGESAQGKRVLTHGDIVTFGVPTPSPEFDYVFEVRPQKLAPPVGCLGSAAAADIPTQCFR